MFDQDQLLKILGKGNANFPKLARMLNVPKSKNREFSKFLISMVKLGKISQTPSKIYFVPKIIETKSGIIRLNSRGFGFIDIEDSKVSVFISPSNVGDSMDKDEVLYDVFEDPNKKGYFQGIVKKVTKRKTKTFVGRVAKFGKDIGLIPHNPSIKGKFRFIDSQIAEIDSEVKVEIVEYGDPSMVKTILVIGHKDDVSIDILAAIEDANIPHDFGPDTIREAKKLSNEIDQAETKNRTDLRNELIVTIDGDDTKDFDDAIHVKKLENGNYILGVHIADVTHYVTEGSPLDEEAKMRGTSVYLADRVIPMLPVELSNGICSLNPHVDRLTMSCETEIDQEGNTINHKIFSSVINSKHRLTYKQVNNFFRNKQVFKDKNLEIMLSNALELSKIMRKFKEKQGYIDFEIEEAKLIIDPKTGKTSDIIPRERFESEMLIEDFMVRANETVATHAVEAKLPFIFRVHDKPDLDRVMNLQGVVKALGMEVDIPTEPEPKSFAKAINQIKSSRFDDFMKMMMLRTMAKAIYSPKNIGHFGLASEAYSHFTSPIRRYPDLIAHRMLREYFFKNNKNLKDHFAEILPGIAEHSSLTEQKAADLERKVADIKKAEFYEKYIGQSFEGTIVSMMKFGFFVEFPNKVDGLIHISSLLDGDYKHSDSGYAITNGVRTFQIGDKVKATVVATMKQEGKIDLVLTDLYEKWVKKQDRMMKQYKPKEGDKK